MNQFNQAYEEIKTHTLLTRDRCEWLWRYAREAIAAPGVLAECGTFRGGSAKLISKAIDYRKTLHVFDTFEGIPASQYRPGDHTPGDFTCSEQDVRAYLGDCPNVAFHKGLVPGSLERYWQTRFCFVHLDMDLYEPTLSALEFFWPRLPPGGVIVLVDDWQYLDSVTEAIEEFSRQTGVGLIPTTNMQCAIRRSQ